MRLPVALLLLLAACAAAGPGQPPALAAPAQSCSKEAVASFVGQKASSDLGVQMLAASGAGELRWIPEGMMVSMLFKAGRLTVYVDATNRVKSVGCF